MLNDLPDEWMVGFAQEWLNPREQRRLACCNHRLYHLLPPPLRIQICSGALDGCCLGGELFVNYQQATLGATASLQPNVPYYFWKFDYQQACPVFLGRQLRQSQPKKSENSRNGTIEYRYMLGFRPRTPNQFWKIQPVHTTATGRHEEAESQDTPSTGIASTSRDAGTSSTTIQSGTACHFIVAGYDTRPGQVDSVEEHRLVAQARHTHSGRSTWLWHTIDLEAKTPEDELSFSYTTSHLARRRSENDLFLLFASEYEESSSSSLLSLSSSSQANKRRRRKRPSGIMLLAQTHPLETYAIPDLSDRGAYLLFSPNRWNAQLAPCHPGRTKSGRSAVVAFSFWSSRGILYFKAVVLPFALAIPVVQVDREYFLSPQSDEARPIVNLFESFSARWGCIKYYMATAADVDEGCPLDLETFLRGVTDHEDHKVENKGNVVSIMIKQESSADATLAPEVPRDDSRLWRFFFSW